MKNQTVIFARILQSFFILKLDKKLRHGNIITNFIFIYFKFFCNMYNYYFRWLVTILFCVSLILFPFSSKSDVLTVFFIFVLLALMRMLLLVYTFLKYKLEDENFGSAAEIEAKLKSNKGLYVILFCGIVVLVLALTVNWIEIFRNFANWVCLLFS